MGRNVSIFGSVLPIEVVIACIILLGFCLLALQLRTLLFLTIVVLFLPSLDMPMMIAVPARILRWAFLVGIVGKGLAANIRTGFRPRPDTKAHRLILLMSVLVAVSASWSIGPSFTIRQGAMMIVLWVGVYIVLWNSWETEDHLLVVCNTLFRFAGLLFTVEFVYLVLNIGGVSQGRYSGVFLNPNGLGTAVAFLGPFVYWKLRTSESGGVQNFAKFLAVVMVISLFQSGSRSGLLGAVVCMGVMFTYVYRARIAVLAGFTLVPLLLLLVLSPTLDATVLDDTRFIRAESLAHFSDRLPMWEKGFEYFLKEPFLGYGFGMNKFVEFGRANTELLLSLIRTRGANYHNTHLQLALDLGLAGVVLLWTFIAVVLRRGLEIYRLERRSTLNMAGMAFFAAFLALTGDSFVHGWMFSPGSSMSIVYFLVAACVMRAYAFTETKSAELEEDAVAARELVSV